MFGCKSHGTPIVTGFAVNHGKPGSILGPSGLAFDKSRDTLYVVDGANNTVVAIAGALELTGPNSIVVGPTGKTFTGPAAAQAKLLYAGAPLNGPIASALAYRYASTVHRAVTGNLVVANTRDPAGKNLLVELSPGGEVLDTVNVDTGAPGAISGIAAIGAGPSTQLFFADDNANNVQELLAPTPRT
jgi:sugar lactone lactonase YvrE